MKLLAIVLLAALCVLLPRQARAVFPAGVSSPDSPIARSVFLRGQFDGRYFLGAREALAPSR